MMKYASVRNMVSPRSGRPVANQFIIHSNNAVIFQSYNSVIAIVDYDAQGAAALTIGRDWDYSTTTAKYLYEFLNEYAKHIFGDLGANRKRVKIAIENKDIAYDDNLR